MDVKEAITQLTGLKKYCEGMAECDESGSYVFDLDVQALDMAITALSPPNEPLTIEQLREMGGQPYWHVGLREESPPPHWNILDPFYAKHIEDYRYGENWLAYRRPPEGEADETK